MDKKELVVGAYCSPQPSYSVNGIVYPSKINLDVYKRLRELGVTVVYGHAEAIGRENERLVFEALELCEQVGLKYFVRDLIAERYVSLGFREYPSWQGLSREEKQELDNEFIASIKRYQNYHAFAGISFYDEPGLDSFDGIAHAKQVFLSVCPDKIFYVNMLPHHISGSQYQFGACQYNVPKSDNELLDVKHDNAERYLYFTKEFIEKVKPQVFSYDEYPFIDLGGIKTNIHTALYELQQICLYNKLKYNLPFWVFMQLGGEWEGSLNRVTNEAEVFLEFNLALSFGADGVQLFPCCFPNDWLNDPKVKIAGVIDKFGNNTIIYEWVKKVLVHLKKCYNYLAESKILGMLTIGEYDGRLPSEEELSKIEWNETIYRGGLAENKKLIYNGKLPKIECNTQILLTVYQYNKVKYYYIVNNSIVKDNDISITLDNANVVRYIIKGEEKEEFSNNISVNLKAGESVLIIE